MFRNELQTCGKVVTTTVSTLNHNPKHGPPIPTIQVGNNLLPVLGLATCHSKPVSQSEERLINVNETKYNTKFHSILPEHQRGAHERSQTILQSKFFFYPLTAQDLKSVSISCIRSSSSSSSSRCTMHKTKTSMYSPAPGQTAIQVSDECGDETAQFPSSNFCVMVFW